MKSEAEKQVEAAETWAEMVGPIVAKFQIGSAFGKGVAFGPDGCKAVAGLLASMARRLDNACVPVDNKPQKLVTDMTQDEFDEYVRALANKRLDNQT